MRTTVGGESDTSSLAEGARDDQWVVAYRGHECCACLHRHAVVAEQARPFLTETSDDWMVCVRYYRRDAFGTLHPIVVVGQRDGQGFLDG